MTEVTTQEIQRRLREERMSTQGALNSLLGSSSQELSRFWQQNGLLLIACLPMLLFLLIPLGALILRVNPASFFVNLMNPEIAKAVNLSVITTSITTLISVIAGTPVAYLLARRRFSGRTFVDTLIDLPMVLPPSVAGIALLMAFGRQGLLGDFLRAAHIEIAFSQIAVIMAQIFVASPYYIKTAITTFCRSERDLEQAAAIDGANPRQIFRLITLPLSWSSLLSGAVMTWARALGEFGATIIFAGNFPGRTQTMPLAIYIGFEINMTNALTLAVILLFISFAVLFLVKRVLHHQIATGS